MLPQTCLCTLCLHTHRILVRSPMSLLPSSVVAAMRPMLNTPPTSRAAIYAELDMGERADSGDCGTLGQSGSRSSSVIGSVVSSLENVNDSTNLRVLHMSSSEPIRGSPFDTRLGKRKLDGRIDDLSDSDPFATTPPP